VLVAAAAESLARGHARSLRLGFVSVPGAPELQRGRIRNHQVRARQAPLVRGRCVSDGAASMNLMVIPPVFACMICCALTVAILGRGSLMRANRVGAALTIAAGLWAFCEILWSTTPT